MGRVSCWKVTTRVGRLEWLSRLEVADQLQNGHSNNSPQKYLYRPLPPRGMSQPIVLMRYDNNGGKLFKVGHNGQNQCPIPRQSTDCNSIKGSTANNVYNWQPGTSLCFTYSLPPSSHPHYPFVTDIGRESIHRVISSLFIMPAIICPVIVGHVLFWILLLLWQSGVPTTTL